MVNEASPLLALPEEGDARCDATWTSEAALLASYSIPMITISVFRYLIMASAIISTAHLGSIQLAAVNLGFLTANIGGFALIIGVVSSLDTLSNQAARSSSPHLSSVYAGRTFVVCMSLMPFLFAWAWCSRQVFGLIMPHADPQMLDLAAQFVRISFFALPGFSGFECIRRYLQSFQLFRGPSIALAVGAGLSMILQYLLVMHPSTSIGYVGAPLSIVIVYNSLFVIVAIYAVLVAPRDGWAGFSSAMLHDLGLNYRYGLASVISVCSEWYANEAMSIYCAYLGTTVQASNAIFSIIWNGVYQIPFGLANGAAIRVGNVLGQGDAKTARKAAHVCLVLGLTVVSINASVLMAVRRAYANWLSDDEEVVNMVTRYMYIVVLATVFDGLQGVSGGLMRGSGMPTLAAKINLVGYWLVGLPIGAFLGYQWQNLLGLWMGMTFAVASSAIITTTVMFRNDWEKRAHEAKSRMLASEQAVQTLGSDSTVLV